MKKNPLEGLESVFPGIAKSKEPSAEMLEAVGVTAKPEPTPLTDAESCRLREMADCYNGMLDRARKLERQLNAVMEALKALTDFPADFFERDDNETVTITITGYDLKAAREALRQLEEK